MPESSSISISGKKRKAFNRQLNSIKNNLTEGSPIQVKGLKGECLVLRIETDINKINWTETGAPAFIGIMTPAGREYFIAPRQIERILK